MKHYDKRGAVQECFAGMRVSCARQYVSLLQKVKDNVFAITVLESRGFSEASFHVRFILNRRSSQQENL